MTIYYPILKKGSSEINALAEVWKLSSSKKMIPIIEAPSKINSKNWISDFNTLGRYLKSRCKDHEFIYQFSTAFVNISSEIAKSWRGSSSENIIEFMYEKLEKEHNNFSPCIRLDEEEWIIDTLSKYKHKKVIIRVEAYKSDFSINQLLAKKHLKNLKTNFPIPN